MKPPKLPSFISILILTTITLVVWVFFEVFRAFTTKPAPNVPPEIITPLSPNLDSASIDKIQKSLFFEQNQIPQNVVSTTTPSPTALPTTPGTPTATSSPSASPTQSSSPSPSP